MAQRPINSNSFIHLVRTIQQRSGRPGVSDILLIYFTYTNYMTFTGKVKYSIALNVFPIHSDVL